MKKRLLALVLVLALALSVVLTACGPSEEEINTAIETAIEEALATYWTKAQVEDAIKDLQNKTQVDALIAAAVAGKITLADATAEINKLIAAHLQATHGVAIGNPVDGDVYNLSKDVTIYAPTHVNTSHNGLAYVNIKTDGSGNIDGAPVFDEIFWPYEWLRLEKAEAEKIGKDGQTPGTAGKDYIVSGSNYYPLFMTFNGSATTPTIWKAALTTEMYTYKAGTDATRVRYFPFDEDTGAIADGALSFEGMTDAALVKDHAEAILKYTNPAAYVGTGKADALAAALKTFKADEFAQDWAEAYHETLTTSFLADVWALKGHATKAIPANIVAAGTYQINRSVAMQTGGVHKGESSATGGRTLIDSPSGYISSANSRAYAVSFTKAGSSYTPGRVQAVGGSSRLPWDDVASQVLAAVEAIGLRNITTSVVNNIVKVTNVGYVVAGVQTGASLDNMKTYMDLFRQVCAELTKTAATPIGEMALVDAVKFVEDEIADWKKDDTATNDDDRFNASHALVTSVAVQKALVDAKVALATKDDDGADELAALATAYNAAKNNYEDMTTDATPKAKFKVVSPTKVGNIELKVVIDITAASGTVNKIVDVLFVGSDANLETAENNADGKAAWSGANGWLKLANDMIGIDTNAATITGTVTTLADFNTAVAPKSVTSLTNAAVTQLNFLKAIFAAALAHKTSLTA